MLLFEVKNQMLKRVDAIEPATDSQQYLKAKFTINDAGWNGKVRTAYFRLGESVYKALLNSNNECVVPSEVLIRSESRYSRTQGSKIFVSLVGEYSTTRITTNEVCVVLNTSGYSDAEEPAAPTESEYQQIITQYANNEAAINKAKAECETARADLVGVKNIFANGIKGNLSGGIVSAEDVSPIEHEPIVKVHGKNLFNPDYLTGTKSLDALSTWGNIIVDKSATAKMLKPNTTYTMSFTAECVEEVEYATFQFAGIGMILYNNGEEVNIGRLWSVDENDWLSLGEKMNFTRTFTTPANMDGWVIMGYTQRALDSGGNAVTNVLKFTNLQVEEGETATEHEAWVDPLTMTVRRCGKNLLKNTLTTSSSSRGVNMIVGADGSIMFTGTSTEVHGIGINASIKLPDGKYILTGGFSNLYLTFWGNSVETGEWVSIGTDRGNGVEVEANGKLYSHYLAQYQALANVTYNAKSFPMIRHVSSTDETYETYIVPTEHTPSSDGTVEGITSLSPNMTILTDTEGAIVECEYIKDTNKVIQKIAGALNITI